MTTATTRSEGKEERERAGRSEEGKNIQTVEASCDRHLVCAEVEIAVSNTVNSR